MCSIRDIGNVEIVLRGRLFCQIWRLGKLRAVCVTGFTLSGIVSKGLGRKQCKEGRVCACGHCCVYLDLVPSLR